jgi:excisionase family DNA binding protein
MDPFPQPKLLPLGEVQARISLSRRGVEKLIASGVLRSVKIGRRRLVDESDLAAFIEQVKRSSKRSE